jgi:hypothetical protein
MFGKYDRPLCGPDADGFNNNDGVVDLVAELGWEAEEW